MKTLWKQIKLQKDLYLAGGLIIVGMYVFGIVIHSIIMALDDGAAGVFYMGSMMAVIGLFVAMYFLIGVHLAIAFNHAVSMGQTRKRFFPAYVLATVFTYMVLAAFVKLLHALEGLWFGLMFRGLEKADPVAFVLQWRYLLAIVVAGSAVGVLLGSTIIKFGRAALWGWWLLLMLICIGGPRLLHYVTESDSQGAFVQTLIKLGELLAAHAQLIAVAVVIGIMVLFFGGSYLLLRKQQVNL